MAYNILLHEQKKDPSFAGDPQKRSHTLRTAGAVKTPENQHIIGLGEI